MQQHVAYSERNKQIEEANRIQKKALRVPDADMWIANSGTCHHPTGNITRVSDTRPPLSGSESVVVDGAEILPIKAGLESQLETLSIM